MSGMLRSAASKIGWMARATTTVVGLVIMLALVLGIASTAFGANGGNFILGQLNNPATWDILSRRNSDSGL